DALTETAYLGEIAGDDVYIRSGPAQVYYPVGKLHKSDKVIVLKEMFGWAQIEPTPQCFSYIAKEFVLINPQPTPTNPAINRGDRTPLQKIQQNQPTPTTPKPSPSPEIKLKPAPKTPSLKTSHPVIGIVTADHVRVRAGSLLVPPANADEIQTKLNKADTVTIIGQRDDYYKIVCPPKCYFWVSLNYVKRAGSVTPLLLAAYRSRATRTLATAKTPSDTEFTPFAGSEKNAYQLVAQMLKDQMEKPLGQRNFAPIRFIIADLIKSDSSDSIKKSAHALLRQVNRQEMVQDTWKRSQLQDQQLKLTLARIDDLVQKLVATEKPPHMAPEETVVKGRLAPSSIFTAKNENQRFLVLDDQERIIYYAVSARQTIDLNNWTGKRLSIIGQATYDAFSKVRLLHVTSLVELPAEESSK
ncbi:MAG: hypothetical protein IID32_08645, partial [Planctomycetes bacterium]|nr:hypothetical protein [Planctomycetota bacterium]